MSPQKQRRSFPSISACNASETASYESIAAALDGTLLIPELLPLLHAGGYRSRQPPPRPRPRPLPPPCHRLLLLLLRSPRHPDSHLHLLLWPQNPRHRARLQCRPPQVLCCGCEAESFEVFDKCKRKVVVTANPTVMVEPFVKDFLGGDKVLGTEIEVNPKTKKATGFVKKPGVLVGKLKRLAVLKDFGDEAPDLGIGDRSCDHDYMSLCKQSLKDSGNEIVRNLDHIFGVEPLKITNPSINFDVSLALRVLEGCCLLHQDNAVLAHQHKAIQV